MVVRIRLSHFGKRHQPLYNIVVSQARTARDSKPMEVLGTYDPTPRTPLASNDVPDTITTETGEVVPNKVKKYKDVSLDISRTKYWLGVGAQPSEPVERLLCLVSCWSALVCLLDTKARMERGWRRLAQEEDMRQKIISNRH